ncbi:urate hydroxylase PuuD [Thalassobaculum sp.]|uniref:urate hydroxylase PuuD n=1 Tax=Thalassobaculum sp. TaxID=2022740 RepID=UPI0032ED12B3
MDAVLVAWVEMILRWLHVVAGIAWIGSSFYFIALDLSLRKRDGLPDGVQGEAWQVHGGGFYNLVKYLVAPARMPDELTWFKWEAYTTWLSGFALMALVYYLGAELFLIDPAVERFTPFQAVFCSLAGLLAGWLLYEWACRSDFGRNTTLLSLAGYVFLVTATWGFTEIFSGRGAFIQVGALIGTIMVANVFVVIIPNQKSTVAALLAGETPDPALGVQAKQRSLHNNYLTLPVVLLMVSNHYPLLFATKYNWVIVAILLALGPVIRHFFNERHAGRASPWWTWGVAALGLAAIGWLSAAGPRDKLLGAAVVSAPVFAAVEEIVISRCSMCHGDYAAWDGIAAAPKGVKLDTPERIHAHAAMIGLNAVRSSAMPPGNVTGMEPGERAVLAAWLAAGAPRE